MSTKPTTKKAKKTASVKATKPRRRALPKIDKIDLPAMPIVLRGLTDIRICEANIKEHKAAIAELRKQLDELITSLNIWEFDYNNSIHKRQSKTHDSGANSIQVGCGVY